MFLSSNFIWTSHAAETAATVNGQTVPTITAEQALQNTAQFETAAMSAAENFMNASAVTAVSKTIETAQEADVPTQQSNPFLDALRPADVTAGWGVNIHFTNPARRPELVEKIDDATIGYVRVDLSWSGVEKTKGVYGFGIADGGWAWDELVEAMAKQNTRVLLIAAYTNPLYDDGKSPYTEAGREAYANYVAAAAEHFKQLAEKLNLPPSLKPIFEIYNEPNVGFWKVPAGVTKTQDEKAREYAQLLISASAAIKAKDKDAVVIGPGLAGIDIPYLREAFKVPGFFDNIDGISVHPYRGLSPPETVLADYEKVKTLIAQFAPPSKINMPLISSEWGYATAVSNTIPNTNVPRTAEQIAQRLDEVRRIQAAFLPRMYLTNTAAGVGLSIFYNITDGGNNPTNPEDRYGILTIDGKVKTVSAGATAFESVRTLLRELDGFTFIHRLSEEFSGQWRMLFKKGSELKIVSWNSKDDFSIPKITAVAPEHGAYDNFLKAASITYGNEALAVGSGASNFAVVTVSNPESQKAQLQISAGNQIYNLEIEAGQTQKIGIPFSSEDLGRVSSALIPMKVVWNGVEVNGLPSIKIVKAEPAVGAEAYAELKNTERTQNIQYDASDVLVVGPGLEHERAFKITNPDPYSAAELKIHIGAFEETVFVAAGSQIELKHVFSPADLKGSEQREVSVEITWNGTLVRGLEPYHLELENPVYSKYKKLTDDQKNTAQRMFALTGIDFTDGVQSAEKITLNDSSNAVFFDAGKRKDFKAIYVFLDAVEKLLNAYLSAANKNEIDSGLSAFFGMDLSDGMQATELEMLAADPKVLFDESGVERDSGFILSQSASLSPWHKKFSFMRSELAAFYGPAYGIDTENQVWSNSGYRKLLSNLSEWLTDVPETFEAVLAKATAFDGSLTAEDRKNIAKLFGIAEEKQTLTNVEYRGLLLKIVKQDNFEASKFLETLSKVAPLHAELQMHQDDVLMIYGKAYRLNRRNQNWWNYDYQVFLTNVSNWFKDQQKFFIDLSLVADLERGLTTDDRELFIKFYGTEGNTADVYYRRALFDIVSDESYSSESFLKEFRVIAALNASLTSEARENLVYLFGQAYGISAKNQNGKNAEYRRLLLDLSQEYDEGADISVLLGRVAALDLASTNKDRENIQSFYGISAEVGQSDHVKFLLKVVGQENYDQDKYLAFLSAVAPIHAAMTEEDKLAVVDYYGKAYGFNIETMTAESAGYVQLLVNIDKHFNHLEPKVFFAALHAALDFHNQLGMKDRKNIAKLFGIAEEKQTLTNVEYRGLLLKIVKQDNFEASKFLETLSKVAPLHAELQMHQDDVLMIYGKAYRLNRRNQNWWNYDYQVFLTNVTHIPDYSPENFISFLPQAVKLNQAMAGVRSAFEILFKVKVEDQIFENVNYRGLLFKIVSSDTYNQDAFLTTLKAIAPLHAAMTSQDKKNLADFYGEAYGLKLKDMDFFNPQYRRLLLNIIAIPRFEPKLFLTALAKALALDRKMNPQMRSDLASRYKIPVEHQVFTNVNYRALLILAMIDPGR